MFKLTPLSPNQNNCDCLGHHLAETDYIKSSHMIGLHTIKRRSLPCLYIRFHQNDRFKRSYIGYKVSTDLLDF